MVVIPILQSGVPISRALKTEFDSTLDILAFNMITLLIFHIGRLASWTARHIFSQNEVLIFITNAFS